MNAATRETLSKVPQVTFVFWLIKIAATTLGETGGDAVSMSMNLGYLVGTAIFAAIFIAAVYVQIVAKQFHPVIYWVTIIASTTVGTTLTTPIVRSVSATPAARRCWPRLSRCRCSRGIARWVRCRSAPSPRRKRRCSIG